jgi:hypothetical protein
MSKWRHHQASFLFHFTEWRYPEVSFLFHLVKWKHHQVSFLFHLTICNHPPPLRAVFDPGCGRLAQCDKSLARVRTALARRDKSLASAHIAYAAPVMLTRGGARLTRRLLCFRDTTRGLNSGCYASARRREAQTAAVLLPRHGARLKQRLFCFRAAARGSNNGGYASAQRRAAPTAAVLLPRRLLCFCSSCSASALAVLPPRRPSGNGVRYNQFR